jgi:YesN/AraC family two-component response regulator
VIEARRYLNEILGHIFFASANNLNSIKIRAMELTVLISRAALDGGADMNNIYQFNLQYISDFFRLETIEDVCFALTEILKKFSEETFRFADVKHVDLLSKAVSFIRTNYMHKITLDDVAEHIYLSPSYLSRIFKEEMKTNFNSYLNSVRIEKSKILLLSEQLSIVEISELVGFFDQSYFNKVFKKATGTTPKKFREQKRNI